ncbi:MAG: cytosine methyltransferase [Frankiales bacterium]|nr:cytosine methyltransferase [Frankiales bacterium]
MGQTRGVLPDLRDTAGRAAFEAAIAVAEAVTEPDPVRRASQIRQQLEPELATAALAQAELRARAGDKFGAEARRLFFTSTGLEQATRRELADHRARRFAAAGASSVLDLCCGIGADALGFTRAGLTVTAVERDPETAAVAAANLAGRRPAAIVEVADAESRNWQDAEAVFLDPARRSDRGRTFDPRAFSPSFEFTLQVLAESRLAAAKLSPGLQHALIPAELEAEWVSFRGGVKESVLWSAGFRVPSGSAVRRRASVLPAGTQLTDADPRSLAVRPIGAYLHEPDGAVIRAGLVQQAAAALNAARIDEHLAYLTSDQPSKSALARSYRVLEVLPYSVKRIKAELQRRAVGIVEIKKRGVDVDPAALRRALKPSGPNSLTLLLARVGQEHLAVLAEPADAR